MKIAVAGTGYVGLSLATLLSQKNEVIALDVIPEKVEKINNRISPIQDQYIEEYFKIFDEYAKDDIDKRDFIMDYLTRINLNDPADLIIITIKNFDIINLKNHKF